MSVGEFADTRWLRIIGLGLLVWLVPFILSFSFFWLELLNKDYYFTVMLGVGMLVALCCAALHLPYTNVDRRWEGLAMGMVWFLMWVVLQCLGMYLLLNVDVPHYLMQEGWRALHIPVITAIGGLLGWAKQQQMVQAERRVKVLHGSVQ